MGDEKIRESPLEKRILHQDRRANENEKAYSEAHVARPNA